MNEKNYVNDVLGFSDDEVVEFKHVVFNHFNRRKTD